MNYGPEKDKGTSIPRLSTFPRTFITATDDEDEDEVDEQREMWFLDKRRLLLLLSFYFYYSTCPLLCRREIMELWQFTGDNRHIVSLPTWSCVEGCRAALRSGWIKMKWIPLWRNAKTVSIPMQSQSPFDVVNCPIWNASNTHIPHSWCGALAPAYSMRTLITNLQEMGT